LTHFFPHIYTALSFSQEVVRGTVHQFLEADNALKLEDLDQGCRIKGTVLTDKVAGNFRFQVKPDAHDDPRTLHAQAPHTAQFPNLDMSHEVKNVYFEGKHDLISKLLGHIASPETPLKNQVTSLDAGVSYNSLFFYSLFR
jgi:hypothetical protein